MLHISSWSVYGNEHSSSILCSAGVVERSYWFLSNWKLYLYCKARFIIYFKNYNATATSVVIIVLQINNDRRSRLQSVNWRYFYLQLSLFDENYYSYQSDCYNKVEWYLVRLYAPDCLVCLSNRRELGVDLLCNL